MSKFYLFCGQYGNKIFVRGYNNGEEQCYKTEFTPTLFVKNGKKTESEWRTIFDEPVSPVTFGGIKDAKEFVDHYKDVGNFEIHGMQQFQYQFINKEYPGDIQYAVSDIDVQTLDIETRNEGGFPDIETANQEILLITLFDKKHKKAITFGTQEWHRPEIEEMEGVEVEFILCRDEYRMLSQFIDYWEENCPGIVTGWNVEGFDFPYLCKRIARVLDEQAVKRLSPFGMVHEKTIKVYGKDTAVMDIVGVVIADYMNLYKKYTYGQQESYTLDNISMVELGVRKLSYDGSFQDFYTNDWDRFVAYNIIDCLRVDQLDDKMQLIDLLLSITFLAKCNVKDTFGTVKPWDVFIFNHLHKQNIAIPPQKQNMGGEFEGAWVKTPIIGMHGWTVSFDFGALYPTIIRQWNISPDTVVRDDRDPITVRDVVLCGDVPLKTRAHELGYTVAANGTFYRKNKTGFIPEILEGTMKGRKDAKKAMLALDKEYQVTQDKALEPKIAALNNRQMAFKILNNSLYGAITNAGFRYYLLSMGEAITLTGQASDMSVELHMNRFLNKVMGTTDVDYVIAGDTDSVYVNMEPVVGKFYPNKSIEDTVKWLDKFCVEACQAVINKSIDLIYDQCNCYNKLMEMKREAIASKALWTTKKRYAMLVHNSEGVDYFPYKLKIMGLDLIKSSTPKVVRDELKDCLTVMFEEGEASLQSHVLECNGRFKKYEPEEISFPRSVNDLTKYATNDTLGYGKGCPKHVRAAILYNKHKRDSDTPIRSGEKIKFVSLRMPNPIGENVIGFPAMGKMPMREELIKYVDWEEMWKSAFLSPLEGLTTACGWHHTKQSTLDDFFC